jgi:hypothetical protein
MSFYIFLLQSVDDDDVLCWLNTPTEFTSSIYTT